MSGATSLDLPNWLAQQKAKNAAEGIGGNLLTPPPAANRPAWWNNPVGAERLNDTYAGMPSPSFSPLVSRSYASRPLTQAEADRIESGARDYSLNLFGNLALAEMPGLSPPGAPGRIAAASVRPPGPYPRPPTPAANVLDAASMAPQPTIRAFHGSPYDFHAFDTSKIGTGEGAQAYGHGLYFAEKEGTAKSYRDNLTVSTPGADPADVNAFIDKHGGDANVALRALLDAGSGANDPVFQALLHYRNSGVRPSAGHMYEVSLNADPEHFLDWDKPLSEQHPKVQAAFENGPLKSVQDYFASNPRNPATGEHVDDVLRMMGHSPAESAQILRAAGIPGIKYLDQGSRNVQVLTPQQTSSGKWITKQVPNGQVLYHGDDEAAARAAGQGTSNFVIFDPKTIEILRKYGIAGLIGAGAASAPYASGAPGQQTGDDR
jgi:hypothetical protein